jgi:hippurate hydrolase
MTLIEQRMKALAVSIAAGFGAQAEVDFRRVFPPLINDAEETRFASDVAASLVGKDQVDRNGELIMASEDFSFMLNVCPGAYITIGNGTGEGGCEVHNPGYDFNDAILPLGASYYARLVERRLADIDRSSGTKSARM